MTIKKPMKTKTAAAAPAQVGGAAIASRLKLDAYDGPAQAAPAGKATTAAVIAGFVALIIVGILTYVLWQHWEFLMPA